MTENITFTMLIELMKECYTPNSNKVKNHYLFHRITQQSNETFDDFVYRVKAEVEHCDFKCNNEECTVKQGHSIRDQILVGTNNETIREDTLKNQWNLNDLLRKGRITESGVLAASQIKIEQTYDVNRAKAGVYSRKFSKKNKSSNQSSSFICWKCESEKCPGYNVNTTRNNVKDAKSLDILLNHVYAKRTNIITVNMNINIKEAMLIEQ